MKLIITFLIISTITLSTTLFAENQKNKQTIPEDLIKYRQSGMMFMSWNMGKIKKQVITNPQDYNKEQVLASARAIAGIANSGLNTLFKPSTLHGKGWKETRVKALYFEQPEKVKQYTANFIKQTNGLVNISSTGDVNKIKVQFKTLLKSCKACHKNYLSK